MEYDDSRQQVVEASIAGTPLRLEQDTEKNLTSDVNDTWRLVHLLQWQILDVEEERTSTTWVLFKNMNE